MRTSEQINAAWTLARESSADGERLRRRIAAIGALSLLVCGFLASIGLGVLVFAFVGGLVVSAGIVALVAVWPRVRPRLRLREWLEPIRVRIRRTRAHLAPLSRRTYDASRATLASARARLSALPSARARLSSVSEGLISTARSTAIRFAPRPARLDPQREAMRLNAAGTQHRRDGRYEEAVESHRRALEILRALGDRRGVALTQSNLALALSRAGDDEWAVGLLEEAAATLRELGDEEHEAQIMANLGLTHRRHGRREQGDNVLELALEKLSPSSNAYRTIEAELGRAS